MCLHSEDRPNSMDYATCFEEEDEIDIDGAVNIFIDEDDDVTCDSLDVHESSIVGLPVTAIQSAEEQSLCKNYGTGNPAILIDLIFFPRLTPIFCYQSTLDNTDFLSFRLLERVVGILPESYFHMSESIRVQLIFNINIVTKKKE